MNLAEFESVAKQLFQENEAIHEQWSRIFSEVSTAAEARESSRSLMALYTLITTVEHEKQAPAEDALLYKDQLEHLLKPYVDDDAITQTKKEIIEELQHSEIMESGSFSSYQQMRESISMNKFKNGEKLEPVEIDVGNQRHVAEIRTEKGSGVMLNNAEAAQWEQLVTSAITSMDDLTADAFDVISLLWMKQAEHPADMIHFSHEDVLEMRGLEKATSASGRQYYQKKHRDAVMERLTALTSIWIHAEEDEDVELVDDDEASNYKKAKLKRLFQIDNVTVARERKTDEMVGIYECDIRPSDLLAGYLRGSEKTTGVLSMKALQYNPNTEKYQKRLTRYLSWQWRIRSSSGRKNYERPFTIGGKRGLLSVIGFETGNTKPQRIKERFEKVLDKLLADNVIAGWRYEEIDESRIGQQNPGWLENYWMKLKIIIEPPVDVKQALNSPMLHGDKEMQKLGQQLDLNPKHTGEQLNLGLEKEAEEETIVTPDNLRITRKNLGKSLKQTAREIGVAHTTLSRFEQGRSKQPYRNSREKIEAWLKEYMEE
ncbi:helix-turn-helix protein [Salsuginibacillus halophilus]|uniref:Helix-turn-helix protein n=1 Tax=Salsuginibacillus halophilus TaxID=517424 RepID=A0A2P8H4W8_9BACI|nr:helix-turn-helix transcriptional regulator [Salsuginibacillus halophilus]PSL41261.1 helix-turn-helix protein [Salsuginibacillus halophilus]